MERTPVELKRPICFSSYGSLDECDTCRYKKSCEKRQAFFTRQSTVDEYRPNSKKKRFRVEDALRYFTKEYKRIGSKSVMVTFSKRWKETMRRVIAACNSSGIDPRLYITAQVETIGRWTLKKEMPFYSNMMEGAKAEERFQEWLGKNEKMYADAMRTEDPDAELVAAETLFVDYYFSGDRRTREVSRDVQKRFPKWSLSKTRKMKTVRVRALRQYLAGINASLPRQLLLLTDRWKWGRVKKELYGLFE